MIHVLARTEQDDVRFNYTIQNDVRYKTYEILLLTMVNETAESEITDKVRLL